MELCGERSERDDALYAQALSLLDDRLAECVAPVGRLGLTGKNHQPLMGIGLL